ncbi:MAG TPA: elongation factor Ts [Alphaproteobacteria bacterium]|nr:elongation factor Ts [Alphaproteobacteria bacterium]
MAEITASLVKELREKCSAGMMDCKKALSSTGGDIEAASDWLRKKGLSTAAKKAGRVAAEGLIGIAQDGNRGAMVEINAETDFIARNKNFRVFVKTVAGLALAADGDLDALKAMDYPGADRTVAEYLTGMIATVGENMELRRTSTIFVDRGVVASYMHNAQETGEKTSLGKIGVVVGLASVGDPVKLAAIGKQIAMHIAAASPRAVSGDDMDPAAVDRERRILADQARSSGKPDNIVEKMVEGRLRKFFEESCLLDQIYVIDGESKVSKVLEEAGKEAGGAITVTGFYRFSLGEGIARKKEDFAAEVAAAAAN